MLINGINTKQFDQNDPDLGAEGYRYASLMVRLIFPIYFLCFLKVCFLIVGNSGTASNKWKPD